MRIVIWSLVVGLGLAGLAACDSEEDEKESSCTWYPDSCPEGMQCFPEKDDPNKTVCLAEGPKALGEACGYGVDEPESWCGRELLCVGYGPGQSEFRCTPMCESSEDCAGWEGAEQCVTGIQSGIDFCSLQ